MAKRVLGLMVSAAVLSACGAPDGSVANPSGPRSGQAGGTVRNPEGQQPESPLVSVGDDVVLSCGSGDPKFAASAMEGGVSGLADEAEVAAALESLAAEAGIDAPRELQGGGDIADAEWIVLGSEGDGASEELSVGVGHWDANGPSGNGEYVILGRRGDGWRAVGWGNCNLAPVLAPGLIWAEIAAPAAGLDRAEPSVTVEVNERKCTSGRDPEPFLNEPVVVESEASVIVYWTSDSPKGVATCPGNPSVRRVVQLREPLGDRALLDGSTWPPKPVSGS